MIEISELLALVDKHTPASLLTCPGLSPGRVRRLTKQPRKKRIRRRLTPRGFVYGWVKVAAANIPPDGVLVPSEIHADTLRTVAGRMGIKLCVLRIGNGPTRLVMPALTGADLSLLSSEL